MNDSRSLGPMLRRYRIKNDILQKDMATRLKISGAQLSKLEMGHHEPLGELTIRILAILIPRLSEEILMLQIEHELIRKS